MEKYKNLFPYFAGIVMASIFGLSFLFTKQALETLPTTLLLAYRFTLAALLLTVLRLFGAIKLNYRNKPVKRLLLLSFFQPIAYFIFETIGVKLTSSSVAGIMIALIPVAVTIFAAVLLNEKPGRMQLVFILASVLGVVFIAAMSGSSSGSSRVSGILALIGAVLAAGIYNILSRKFSMDFTPVEITFFMMWTGAVVFNILAIVSGIMGNAPGRYFSLLKSMSTIVPVLYLGVLSSVCAFFLSNYMLSKLPASNSSVFSNLTTIISIIAGVFVRHEEFRWYQMAGSIIIILGVWGTNRYRPKQQVKL